MKLSDLLDLISTTGSKLRSVPRDVSEASEALDKVINPPDKALQPAVPLLPNRYQVESNVRGSLADLMGLWRGYVSPRVDDLIGTLTRKK